MISKNEILKFVKEVHHRGKGVPDRRPMHASREWFFGISIFISIIAVGIFVSLEEFQIYKTIDQRTYTVDIQIPSYNQPLAQTVLSDFGTKKMQYEKLTQAVLAQQTLDENIGTSTLDTASSTDAATSTVEIEE